MQVSRLVYNMKEESDGITESATRKQVREKIAALPQPRFARAADALAMILDGMKRPLKPPAAEPRLTFSATPPVSPRVKLALLKSIPTGTFIDVQFYAHNAIGNNLPLDPKPLFTSSIVIKEWRPAITTSKWWVPHNSDSNLRRSGRGDRIPSCMPGGWADR